MCSIDGILLCVFCSVSLITIVYLCIDRVITIKFPLRYPMYFTREKVICINIGIWCFVSLGYVLGHLLFGIKVTFLKGPRFCAFKLKNQPNLILILFFINLMLPACAILTCAAILHHVVHKQIQQVRALEGTTAATWMESIASHKRAFKTIFCMVAGFYVCWSPMMVLELLDYFYGYTYSTTTNAIVYWLALSNSIWNSLVYLPTIKEYRKIFKNVFILKIFSSET